MEQFLQSSDWTEFQKKLGRRTYSVSVGEGRFLAIRYPLPLGKNYMYVPRVKIAATATFGELIEKCRRIAAEEKSVFIKIEPDSETNPNLDFKACGFKRVESLQPTNTLVIDLSKNEEMLFKNMEHDTRYAIKTAEKRGVSIEKSDGIGRDNAFAEFWPMFLETNRRQSISSYDKRYYEELSKIDGEIKTEIFLAKLENSYIAGAIILHYKDTATYLYAASRSGYGKYNAPSLIIWRAMLDAKKKGLKYFDFWGISDVKSKWAGFTAFKRSFDGQEVKYPGGFDLPINKPIYFAYKAFKRLLR